jgi:hypothetical protein
MTSTLPKAQRLGIGRHVAEGSVPTKTEEADRCAVMWVRELATTFSTFRRFALDICWGCWHRLTSCIFVPITLGPCCGTTLSVVGRHPRTWPSVLRVFDLLQISISRPCHSPSTISPPLNRASLLSATEPLGYPTGLLLRRHSSVAPRLSPSFDFVPSDDSTNRTRPPRVAHSLQPTSKWRECDPNQPKTDGQYSPRLDWSLRTQ